MTKIDLNCDMGESFGAYKLGMDDEVIQLVTSANIACGFHAGDPNVMDETVKMARDHGVGIGVHMGYPDLVGFGRRDMDVSKEDLINDIIYQIGAMQAFARKHGVDIQHIKAHGSMGNTADVNETVAEAIVTAASLVVPGAKLFVKPGSVLHKTVEAKGLSAVLEIYADRAYTKSGTLVPRKTPGAVIEDPEEVAENVARMVLEGKAKTIDGDFIDIQGESVCVHGDTQGAIELVRRVKRKLEDEGVEIAPVGDWHGK